MRLALAAAGALALGLLAWAGSVLIGGAPGPRRPSAPPPRLVETLRPAEALGGVAAGFGDAWFDDRARGRIVRVDGRTGRAVARIPVDGRVAVRSGAGALWVLQGGDGFGIGLRGPLLRIDPATNRVRARIPLPVLGFGVLPTRSGVWIWGPSDIVRIDPRSNRVVRRIVVRGDHGELKGLAVRSGRLLAATADGHLLRFDAGTGALVSVRSVGLGAPVVRLATGRRILLSDDGAVVSVDAATGRVAWRRELGYRVGAVVEEGGRLWAHSAASDQPGDRLSALDPATGRVVTSGVIPAFGTTGMATVRGRVWVATAGGRVVVLRPFSSL